MKDQKFLALYQRQQESGLTIIEFCSNEGIAPATFHYWKKKTKSQNRLPGFIPVVINSPDKGVPRSIPKLPSPKPPSPAVQDCPIVEVEFPNKTIVRLKNGVDLNILKALIHLSE